MATTMSSNKFFKKQIPQIKKRNLFFKTKETRKSPYLTTE